MTIELRHPPTLDLAVPEVDLEHPPRGPRRHLLTLATLKDDELRSIASRAAAYTLGRRPEPTLRDRIVGIYFAATSTRTRTAFSTGALRLGAQIVTFGPHDLQTNTGESVDDTGRVLAGMLDALVARTAGPDAELEALARHPGMAVVNAMTVGEHPTQGITDLATIEAHRGEVDGARVLYVGEGNNTAVALARGLCRYEGVHLEIRTPPGYGLPDALVDEVSARAAAHGSRVVQRHDMVDADIDADVVYTTRWQTTGTSKPDPDWREAFAPFRLSEAVSAANPRAWVMHDLPAHRGEDIDASVLDGPRSIAFAQARAKQTGAMAVLEWALGVQL